MTTTIHQFVSMVASFNAAGDKVSGKSWKHPGYALDTLDTIIGASRNVIGNYKVPTKDFIEDGWAFRIFNPGQSYTGFRFFPKGERGDWSGRGEMTVGSDGRTWMFTVFINRVGQADARPSFAEAKAEILRLLGKPEAR